MTHPSPTALEEISGALDALRTGQRQLDQDGVFVGVSRQALDEVLTHIAALAVALDKSQTIPDHEHLTWDNCPHEHIGCQDCGAPVSGAATPAPTAAHLRRFREQTEAEVFGYVTGVEDAAALYESVNPASDDERIKGSPGAGAMGAVIEYRDKIRELLHAKSPPQGAEE